MLCVRWLAGFWMLVFSQLFKNNTDFLMKCGNFWCANLSFGWPDASTSGPQGTIVAAWGHPGARREQQKPWESDLIWFPIHFGTPIWELDQHIGAQVVFVFHASWNKQKCFFCFIYGSTEIKKQAFGVWRCVETNCSQVLGFCWF